MSDTDTVPTAATGSGSGPAPDPFGDLSAFRLDPSVFEATPAKKLLTQIPVRKPAKQDFVRVNPDPAYRLDPAAIIELKEERENYLVRPDIFQDVQHECAGCTLFLGITRQGVLFVWPVRLPDSTGRANPWHESAREAAELAMGQWVRVSANMNLGGYEVSAATATIPDPTWPKEPFHELLKIAFKNRVIDSVDHPVLQQLRGEV